MVKGVTFVLNKGWFSFSVYVSWSLNSSFCVIGIWEMSTKTEVFFVKDLFLSDGECDS